MRYHGPLPEHPLGGARRRRRAFLPESLTLLLLLSCGLSDGKPRYALQLKLKPGDVLLLTIEQRMSSDVDPALDIPTEDKKRYDMRSSAEAELKILEGNKTERTIIRYSLQGTFEGREVSLTAEHGEVRTDKWFADPILDKWLGAIKRMDKGEAKSSSPLPSLEAWSKLPEGTVAVGESWQDESKTLTLDRVEGDVAVIKSTHGGSVPGMTIRQEREARFLIEQGYFAQIDDAIVFTAARPAIERHSSIRIRKK